MQTGRIKARPDEAVAVQRIFDILPTRYKNAYNSLAWADKVGITEIRIRADMPCSFTACGRNIPMRENAGGAVLMSDIKEIESIVYRLCEGSVYSCSEHIKKGYIPFCGTRVGISGTAYTNDGKIQGFNKVSSLNIRIPRYINAADDMLSYIEREGVENSLGVIAVSPPNGGKTTFLRSLAKGLSDTKRRNPMRVCIIDEREELFCRGMLRDCICDVISGIPKAVAIELAVRTLSPQLIVCDEIGGEYEAKLLYEAALGGVYLAASFHGAGTPELLRKDYLKKLICAGAFKTAWVAGRHDSFRFAKIERLSEVCEAEE